MEDSLKIDCIEACSITGGRIFASCAPGKIELEKDIVRNLEDDVKTISESGISVVISLIEDFEFDLLSISHFPELLELEHIQFIHYPIRDHFVPDNIDSFHKLIIMICELFLQGHSILVHCRGGVGRTGLVCASFLLHFGSNANEAIDTVRDRRERALRNPLQCEYLKRYERLLR